MTRVPGIDVEVSAKAIGDALADRLAEVDPLWALESGLPADRLPRLDPSWWQERRAVFADAAEALRPLAASRDRDVLLERAEAETEWIDSSAAMCGLQAAMDGTLFRLRYALDNVADERRVAVEATLPAAVDGYLDTLRASFDTGVVATRRQVTATIEAIRDWIDDGVPAAASFAAVADYLRDHYLERASDDDSVGGERFALWARRYTGASITDDDCEWAAAELATTFEQLRALEATGGGLVLATEAEHVAWAESELARAGAACADADILPSRGWPALTVRTFGGGGQQAYYAPRAVDGSTDATVWIAGGDGPHRVEYEKTVLFHESIPGHHVEATLQSEATSLSRYQRLIYLPAHSEGWGLYAEHLAEDAGLIDTPQARAGRLGSRALRLASLLIDVGVHTGRPVPARFAGTLGSAWSEATSRALLEAVGLGSDVAAWWFTSMIGQPAHRASYSVGERAWTDLARRHAAAPRAVVHQSALAVGPMGLDLFRSLTFG